MLFEQMFERVAMQVQTGPTGDPTRFRWAGRWYTVLAVLFSWMESAAWWRSGGSDVRCWRVEARALRTDGVYDIADADGHWYVRRVMD